MTHSHAPHVIRQRQFETASKTSWGGPQAIGEGLKLSKAGLNWEDCAGRPLRFLKTGSLQAAAGFRTRRHFIFSSAALPGNYLLMYLVCTLGTYFLQVGLPRTARQVPCITISKIRAMRQMDKADCTTQGAIFCISRLADDMSCHVNGCQWTSKLRRL